MRTEQKSVPLLTRQESTFRPLLTRERPQITKPFSFSALKVLAQQRVINAWRSSKLTREFEDISNNPEELARRRVSILEKAAESLEQFVVKEIHEVCRELGVNATRGLSTSEATARLERQGPNALVEDPPPTFWELLLDQFKDLLVIMLIVSAIISIGLGEYNAGIVILCIVVFNAALGVKMELGAEEALEALKKQNPPKCEVRRDGQVKRVPTEELVPGDIVLLSLGAKIPADMRLINSADMQCNEMALTGESAGVPKDEKMAPKFEHKDGEKPEKHLTDSNMVYMGCTVINGNGEAIVVHTGMKTKMGEIAHLLQSADEGDSPLQIKLHKLGVNLGFISLFCSAVVFGFGVTLGHGDPTSTSPLWLQMLLVAVSLTVAAVPEGLPVCVTMSLAIGMTRMANLHKVRILKLRSVETLGSANVVCTDKTGTLTKGEMTAVRLWHSYRSFQVTGGGYDPEGFVAPLNVDPMDAKAMDSAHNQFREDPVVLIPLLAGINSNAEIQFNKTTNQWECTGNGTERPLVVLSAKAGFNQDEVRRYKKIAENPFNSTRKMSSSLFDLSAAPDRVRKWLGNPCFVACIVGAPNVILKVCNSIHTSEVKNGGQVRELKETDKQGVLQVIDAFSEQSLRVLAVAFQTFSSKPDNTSPEVLETNLTLYGLVASQDPARPEVGPCIRRSAEAGIRTIMITGDYVKTAKAIAEDIGILPKGSPKSSAIDCETFRAIGEECDAIETKIAEGKGSTALESKLATLQKRLDSITATANVYGRAKPVDKITIVKSLQRQGNVCGMTGDGVNDAPALKQANIGIAMGITGTDVAKAAADMILLNDNFVGITAAIEQGRTVYANIVKFVFYILSTNTAEVLLILIGVLMGLPPPLVPIQILWLNLATDGAPAIALALEATEPDTMQQSPRPLSEPILDSLMITGIVIQTIVLTAVTLGGYIAALYWETGTWNADPTDRDIVELEKGIRVAQTCTILIIVFAELFRSYSCRSMRESVFSIGLFRNKWMQVAVGTSIVCTVLVANVPGVMGLFGLEYLSKELWGFVIAISFIPFVVDEITKCIYRCTGFGLRRPVRLLDTARVANGDETISVRAPLLSPSISYGSTQDVC